jgi:hypothetical protein
VQIKDAEAMKASSIEAKKGLEAELAKCKAERAAIAEMTVAEEVTHSRSLLQDRASSSLSSSPPQHRLLRIDTRETCAYNVWARCAQDSIWKRARLFDCFPSIL